jgi:MYXO-CTERM domain-containing protein
VGAVHRLLAVLILAITAPAVAAPVHGLVYDDKNGDGRPNFGEPGIAKAIVAFGVTQFVETDAHGGFTIDVPANAKGIVWVRVPDGFVPGPVWARVDGAKPDVGIDLALKPTAPHVGPVTFVVAADSHLAPSQPFANDLAQVAADATALDPAPAFFTILGDITQGNQVVDFELVDRQLEGLAAPYIPVPGNHDWYDGGATWFSHYGPDNYSFDIGTTHFVVWNMAMSEDAIRDYLGAELSHVEQGMAIVAMTHAPPSERVVDALRSLGVDYVLTGHTHSNRVVDHDGVIELNSEPLLMGGLDFTPSGYRVMTIDRGVIGSYHRTVVDHPLLEVMAPGKGQCVPMAGGRVIAAVEYDAGDPAVTARVDCATPIALRFAGGWSWQADLPMLTPGPHSLTVTARAGRASTSVGFEVCAAPTPPAASGDDWPQLGGAPDHAGARDRELAPPLAARWATPIGGHVLQAAPAIVNGTVYITAADLGDGNTGGVVALDLATGAVKWRTTAPMQVRGGPAVTGTTVAVAQVDGTILGLDTATGTIKWRSELGAGLVPGAAAIFAPPAADGSDILVGNQNRLAAISGAEGAMLWSVNPVPEGIDSEALSAIAIRDGAAVGVFNRALGGVSAWDRMTGAELWRFGGALTTAINASPVMADGLVYIVNGMDDVFALDAGSGAQRWQIRLDPAGFDWGNATIGTPALAKHVLVVPTLYKDLVALDATSGLELWRYAGTPSPIRATHYRGGGEAGFEATPVITGDIVWAADTAGQLTALDLHTGAALWHTALGTPVLGGLAVSGDWMVVASFDGTVRGFAKADAEPTSPDAVACEVPEPADAGCCSAGGDPTGALGLTLVVGVAMRRRRASPRARSGSR